jgi:hypothetical protein
MCISFRTSFSLRWPSMLMGSGRTTSYLLSRRFSHSKAYLALRIYHVAQISLFVGFGRRFLSTSLSRRCQRCHTKTGKLQLSASSACSHRARSCLRLLARRAGEPCPLQFSTLTHVAFTGPQHLSPSSSSSASHSISPRLRTKNRVLA